MDTSRGCKAYAEKNGYKVLATYIDRALAGKSVNRPQFLQMVEDGKNRFDNVIYKDALEERGVKPLEEKSKNAEEECSNIKQSSPPNPRLSGLFA